MDLRRGQGEIHTAAVQMPPQIVQQGSPVRPGQVHFVDKQHRRHPVALQQLPQGAGVSLNAVGAADDQNGAVQHLKGPLRLGGEVHMARGVDQLQFRVPHGQPGLLGEDGDAPVPLDGVGVQKGVPVVHPAQPAQHPGAVQKGLGQRGLARIHMG